MITYKAWHSKWYNQSITHFFWSPAVLAFETTEMCSENFSSQILTLEIVDNTTCADTFYYCRLQEFQLTLNTVQAVRLL